MRLDDLGFDEAWIGEHHSAGWETISEPALIIAVAGSTAALCSARACRACPTTIRLTLADRFVQLDQRPAAAPCSASVPARSSPTPG
ncbi:MAG: hypothetical protein U0531_11810 [Dehalococcoidia bacterium]